jgi:hypothetical protein
MSEPININLIIKKEDLRDALEALVGNERLDADAIKNLPAALGAANGIQIVDGNYELGGNIDKNTLLSALIQRVFEIESIHVDEENAFTNVKLEVVGDGFYGDSIKLLSLDTFTAPNPLIHLNIEAGGICQVGDISGLGAYFDLTHLTEKRFIDNRSGSNKTGLQLRGFGETNEDGDGANYSTLVGTSLVPKKYVESKIKQIFRFIDADATFEYTQSSAFRINSTVVQSGVALTIKLSDGTTDYVLGETVDAFDYLIFSVDVAGSFEIIGEII